MKAPFFAFAVAISAGVHSAGAADWKRLLDAATGNDKGKATDTATTTQAAGLTNQDITSGLREALGVGAERAVGLLAREGGYLDDPEVRIPLPGPLQKAAKGFRLFGKEQLVKDFETTVNRAAEQAIQRALPVVRDTVSAMTLSDVRKILNGPDDSATRYLKEKAGGRLHEAVRPIVAEATESTGATRSYKRLASQVGSGTGGWLDSGSLDLDDYVTGKTLDGLYLKLAEEERKIRTQPVARTTEILKKVFGR